MHWAKLGPKSCDELKMTVKNGLDVALVSHRID